jgi:hypothetical protein
MYLNKKQINSIHFDFLFKTTTTATTTQKQQPEKKKISILIHSRFSIN